MSRIGKIYSPRELAAELRIPPRAVLRAIRRGELKRAKISPAVFRIEGADVDAWLKTLKNR
jgi:excisionase family DNA binding protein